MSKKILGLTCMCRENFLKMKNLNYSQLLCLSSREWHSVSDEKKEELGHTRIEDGEFW